MSEVEETFDLNSVDIDNADIFKEELKYDFSEDQLKYLCKKDYLKVVPYKTNALTVLEKKLKREQNIKFNRTLRLQLRNYLDVEKNNRRVIKYYIDSFTKFQSTKQKRWEQRKINSLFSLGILHLSSYENEELNSLGSVSNASSNRTIFLQGSMKTKRKETHTNTEEFLPGIKQNFNSQESMRYEEDSSQSFSTESFLPGAKQNNTTNLHNNFEEKEAQTQSQTYSQFQPIGVSTQNSNPFIE